MNKRTSIVNKVKVNIVQSASVFYIGDCFAFTPRSKGYAVGQISHQARDEHYEFSDSIFLESIPKPTAIDVVHIDTFHDAPVIHVDHVYILSIGNSSGLQIGSTKFIDSEARIKHVRKLI